MNRIKIYKSEEELEIILDWYTPMSWLLLFFTILFTGVLSLIIFLTLKGEESITSKLIILLPVAIACYLIYYTLCMFFNRTYISINKEVLTILHKPFPWRGSMTVLVQDIEQLYTKRVTSSDEDGESTHYELRLKLKGKRGRGRGRKLLSLDDGMAEEVNILEQRLEEFMGITNYPVRGEYIAPKHR